MKKYFGLAALSSLLLLQSCQCPEKEIVIEKPITFGKDYAYSIEDTKEPLPTEAFGNLVPITKENKVLVWKTYEGEDYVKMVSVKESFEYFIKGAAEGKYDTKGFPIWVTPAPQLKTKLSKNPLYGTSKEMRLKQLLGLPPVNDYNFVIEMWVKPQDMFRPCPDKEITDKTCGVTFPDKSDTAHISWIENYRANSYYNDDLYNNYPWSQLGYTYDWNANNTNHVGCSEFVIDVNSTIIIDNVYTIDSYFE